MTAEPEELKRHVGELVRIRPQARTGHARHFMRGRLVGVHKQHALVQPARHRKVERIEARYVLPWKSREAVSLPA